MPEPRARGNGSIVSEHAFPQYAKSTHPEVIATVEANAAGWREHHAQACAFAERFGADRGAYFPGGWGARSSVAAINAPAKPTDGDWKRGPSGYGWAPFKRNPLRQEFDALTFTRQPVPGLPEMLRGPDLGNGRHMIVTPTPFIREGVAYVGFSIVPAGHEYGPPVTHADGGWEEILGSEYHSALEQESRS